VGTSSLRREAQLLDARADLQVESLRGNVPSRVAQVREGRLDAAVLASAGLHRLKLDLHGLKQIALPEKQFVPAPGQGALAIESTVSLPSEILRAVTQLNDPEVAACVRIERRIMKELEGGCTLPFGAYCERVPSGWHVWAFLGLTENRGKGPRDWLSFHRFDICSDDEETLVAETVRYFRARKGGE
jgi:hydroxymethylbilane synthase